MQVIGQYDDGVEGEGSTAAGIGEDVTQVVDVLGQEPAPAFQQCDCEEERSSGNEGADVVGHAGFLLDSRQVGWAALSRPTAFPALRPLGGCHTLEGQQAGEHTVAATLLSVWVGHAKGAVGLLPAEDVVDRRGDCGQVVEA